MKIFIDPGHGGDSIGASYKGRLEQDDTLRLSLAVRDILLTMPDTEVRLAREGNTNPSLEKRAADANNWGADYFLSIHRNAIGPNIAKGVEGWVYSAVTTGGETYNKAKNIVDKLCEATGFYNRGVKKGAPSYSDFAVNRLTNMSSCLLEAGFIDSDTDNAVFDKKFNEMAESIAKSVYEAAGGKRAEKEEAPVISPEEGTEDVTEGVIYTIQAAAFISRKNAENMLTMVKDAGFKDAFISVKGDIDGDGRLTSSDAAVILRKSVGQ